jgi:hypothetical protein
VVCLADHVKTGFRFDDLPQAKTENRMIVRDDNTDFILL